MLSSRQEQASVIIYFYRNLSIFCKITISLCIDIIFKTTRPHNLNGISFDLKRGQNVDQILMNNFTDIAIRNNDGTFLQDSVTTLNSVKIVIFTLQIFPFEL